MLDFSPSSLLRNLTRVSSPLGQIRQLAVLGAVLLGAAAADAKNIYVNGADTTPGNGTTWAASFKYLQDALKVAVAGDSIYMAKGTYYPDDGKDVFGGDRELSFEIDGLKIYGGYAVTDAGLAVRNVVSNPTILSGEIFPIVDAESQGFERYWSLHVLVLKGSSTFDGLTVEKGRANGDEAPYNQGGGCLVPSGMALTLVNCTFRENLAAESGGAVWGKVVATNSTFSDNEVNNEFLYAPTRPVSINWQPSYLFSPNCQGGAITGDVTAKNCQFSGNSVDTGELDLGTTCSSTGGAISGTTIKLDDCIFDDNSAFSESEPLFNTGSDATSKGGAIAGNVTARNCTFTNNEALAISSASVSADRTKPAPYTAVPSSYGGAITGETNVVNCSFANNFCGSIADRGDNFRTRTLGGALYMETKSSVVNCTFFQNSVEDNYYFITANAVSSSTSLGGAVYAASPIVDTATVISSSTFVDNRSPYFGAAISCAGRVNLISNIFWYGEEESIDGRFQDEEFLDGRYQEEVFVDDDIGSLKLSELYPSYVYQSSMIYVSGTGRISNRLYPTPLTETKNIVKGGMESVEKGLGANLDFGDPPERTLISQDPMFVNVVDPDGPVGPDGIWRTEDDGLRLLVGSPATGIGHPLFIPKDTLDLDDDGNISENIPEDAAGYMRIQDGTMDLGAYELGDRRAVSEIVVEGPTGIDLEDGVSTVDLSTTPRVATTFVIRNTGFVDLTKLAITCNGANASEFKITQPVKNPLPSGDHTTFTVTFNPLVVGMRQAAIHISSNDTDESPFDIALKGSAPVPDIAVEYPGGTGLTDGSSVINYGSIGATSSASRTFTIRNKGVANLSILTISSSGTNAASFKASAPAQAVLAPNASTTFNVTFSPSGAGVRNASIIIQSNDPDSESSFLIKVTGNGIGSPEIFVSQPYSSEIVDGATNDFGSVQKSLLHSKTFIVKNTGLATLKNIAVSLTGSAAFTKTQLPVTSLSPGTQAKFTVTFKPGSLGKKTAALQITSNDANEGDLDINLVGTCIAKSSSTLTKASDSLTDRRSEGSGGVVTVTKDSEGLKYLVLTVQKPANWGVRKHTVEVSPNLLDWFSGSKHTTTLVNNANVLKVRDNTPIRDGKKRYIRVK